MSLTYDNREYFSAIEFSLKPFPYFFSPSALTEDSGASLLAWLESCESWKLTEAEFYEQYEFSLLDIVLPPHLSFLTERIFQEGLITLIEESFGVSLQRRVDCTAHKLVPQQRIRLHNDYIPGRETHRLLIQLNRGWKDEDGGLLMFFNSLDPADVDQLFRPTHNSAIGFAITSDSHHAVSTVYGGERFTLVYSFYAQVNNA